MIGRLRSPSARGLSPPRPSRVCPLCGTNPQEEGQDLPAPRRVKTFTATICDYPGRANSSRMRDNRGNLGGVVFVERELGRQRTHLPSVSRSLQIAAFTVALLIIAATAQQLARARDTIIANTEQHMARLDMVFAEQTGRAAETVDFILRNTIDAVQQLPAGTQPQAALMDDLMRHWVEGVRQVRGVCVTDKNGTIIFTSGPPMQGNVPGALPAAVAWHAAHGDAQAVLLRISVSVLDCRVDGYHAGHRAFRLAAS